MTKNKPRLSVCVPAYNEENTIEEVLRNLLSLKFEGKDLVYEIIVGDDGSKDSTVEIVQKVASDDKRVTLIKHPKNLGKTQNVKQCILQSTGDVVLIQDADLESDQNDIIKLYKEFKKDPTKIIYGNRFHESTDRKGPNYWGNRLVTLISNIFTGFRDFYVCDMEVNYKMADGDLFRDIASTVESESCFGFEPEMTAKFARSGMGVKNVDIKYDPRTAEEGKHMNAFRDGAKAVFEILKFNLFYRGYKGYNSEQNDEKTRILLATHRAYPTTGGLERHVFKIGNEIAKEKKNFEVLNISFTQGNKNKTKIKQNFLITKIKSFFIIGNAYPLPTPLQMLRYYVEIGRFNPDVVHTHGRHFFSTWLAITWAISHRRKIIHTEHGGEIYFTNSILANLIKFIDKTFIRLMLNRASSVTAVSNSVADYLFTELKIKDIQLVRNFIDPIDLDVEVESSNIELEKVLLDKRKIIAFPYRLVDSKGFKFFIQLAIENQDNDEILFVGAGDGPGDKEFMRSADELQNFVFLGTLSHKDSLRLIKQADIVINFSAQEGLPTTLMEAMWFKRKLLITDIGPNLEVTENYMGKVVCKREMNDISKKFSLCLVEQFNGDMDFPEDILLSTTVESYKMLYTKGILNNVIPFTLSSSN